MQIQNAAKRALSLALAGAITVGAAVPAFAVEPTENGLAALTGEQLPEGTGETEAPEGETPAQNSGETEAPKGKTPAQGTGEAEAPKGETPAQGTGETEAPKGETLAQGTGEAEAPKGETPAQGTGETETPEGKTPAEGTNETEAPKAETQDEETAEKKTPAEETEKEAVEKDPVKTSRPLSVDDIVSVQAYTDATFYGTGVVQVDVEYQSGIDLTDVTVESYVLEDRGTLTSEFGQIDLANVSVDGQTVTLNVKLDSDATEANKLVYTGDQKEGARQRNSYGVYVTGPWYRDANGQIQIGNKGQQGYQARECLELRLHHATEAAEKALCLTDENGHYTNANKWNKTVDRQFGEGGFKNLYDLKIPSTGANGANGDAYVQGYYYIPENYDPSKGIVFTLQGQGISFWKLKDGTNNAGTGIMFDSATTSWADQGAIVVNIHDRSTTYTLPDGYDFVLDDVNVMKHFIDTYKVTGPVVLQGNSRGTMASNIVIKALAGCEYDPAEQGMGTAKSNIKKLDKNVYDFVINTYICQNGTFGGNLWDNATDDWNKIAATGLRAWIFDGEQDTNNIDNFAKWKQALKANGFSDSSARLTGLTSNLYYPWGESDHSATRINGWYFGNQAYYGPSLHIDEQGRVVYDQKLNDGDTYKLEGRGAAGTSNKAGYEYTVYDDAFHAWALREKTAAKAEDLQSKVTAVKATVTPNFYGQRVSKVEITFADDVTAEKMQNADIAVYDRGTLNPDFGALTVANRKVNGHTVTLTINDGMDGSDKLTDRSRNSFGMLNTTGWYMDSAGNIYCNNATAVPGQDNLGNVIYANENGKTCQGRNLDLILCVDTDLANGIRSTDLKGKLLPNTVWSAPVITGGNEQIVTEFVNLTGKTVVDARGNELPLSTGYTQVGDGKSVPVQVIYPEGYDKNRAEAYPAIVYQCGGGVCYWEIAGGTKNNIAPANNLGCNTVYDNMLAQWHTALPEAVIMAVNVHSGPSTAVSAAEINEVLRYAEQNWNIASDKVVMVGNSQGTIITSDAIRQAPELFAGFVECNGNFGGNVNGEVNSCNGTVKNSSFKYWTEEEVKAMIRANVGTWLFNGETDGTNPAIAQDTYTTLVNLYKAAGKSDAWLQAHVRVSGLQSWKFTAMGETDHSVTKVVADKYISTPYNDVTADGAVLNADDTYSIYSGQNRSAYSATYDDTAFDKFCNFRYTVYAESVAQWARSLFYEKEQTLPDMDDITSLDYDYSQAAQLPLTGYFTKHIGSRTMQMYLSENISIRPYYTVVAVPDGVNSADYLAEQGWFDVADEKGEGLVVLEPGENGWGTPQEEIGYIADVMNFVGKGVNAKGAALFSTFGEYYLVGYGKGAAALEYWAAQYPIMVIAQTYVNGRSIGGNALTAVASTLYDGKNANGDLTDVLDETIEKVAISGKIAPKDIPVPTLLAGYSGSEEYWKSANDCMSTPTRSGVFAQSIDSDAYATHYANGVRKANGETTGLSEVKITNDAGKAQEIYAYMAQWTRYDTTFAYSNALNTRLDYTAAKMAAQDQAKDGTVKESLTDGTEIWGTGSAVIPGHGTVDMGVFAFSDNNGDGKNDPREYLMYIPESHDGEKLPVVMIYPGNTQSDMIFMDSTMWWQVAEREGIILAFVCETYSSPVAITHVDSDKFYDAYVTLMKEKYADRIDFSRLYGSGQSLGSMTTQGFALTSPERFAAVASTSATPLDMSQHCDRMIPSMLITGHTDIFDLAKGFDSESLKTWAGLMMTANGLNGNFSAAGADALENLDSRHPEMYIWNNASGIPMLEWGQCLLRPHNTYPSEGGYLWNFLKHYSMDENGTRYYSASGFTANDAVAINKSAKIAPSGSSSGSSSSSSGKAKQENTVYHSLTAIAHEGGTISSLGVFGVAEGTSKYYEISPNAGCHVARVIVDGVDVGAVTNYTFRNIRDNHTIEVFFSGNGVSTSGRANPQTGIY
mgnify:FL=1